MRKFILSTCLLISLTILGQENYDFFYKNPQIDTLIQKYKLSKKNTQITVYRIQLESSESLDKVTKITNKHSRLFPQEEVVEIFEPPYFKAITGIYIDKKHAEKKLQEIREIFKSSFIFQEEINMEDFKKNKSEIN